MDVLPSAFRHGIANEDVQHALRNALVVEQVADDPDRFLVLGPDLSARILELIVLDRPIGPAVIHAMLMRQQYRSILEGEQ